jgi:hypothetical protein
MSDIADLSSCEVRLWCAQAEPHQSRHREHETSVLADMMACDVGLSVLDDISIRDVMALAFVSKDVRHHLLALLKKYTYLSTRINAALVEQLQRRLPDPKAFLSALASQQAYLSGSLVLMLIVNSWWDYDLDIYASDNRRCNALWAQLSTLLPGMSEANVRHHDTGYCEHLIKSAKYTHVLEHKAGDVRKMPWPRKGDWIDTRELVQSSDGDIMVELPDHDIVTERRLIELDILDASLGGTELFDMTIVQNRIYPNGRVTIGDPWSIVMHQLKFTTSRKLAFAESARYFAHAIISCHTRGCDHLDYETKCLAGTPMGMVISRYNYRVQKYIDRGFHVSDDLASMIVKSHVYKSISSYLIEPGHNPCEPKDDLARDDAAEPEK